MLKDAYDKILWFLLTATLIALVVVLLGQGTSSTVDKRPAVADKALEREMAYQARVGLLQKLYNPVESLRQAGNPQAALFRLDELIRRYPTEAHGHILKGEILHEMGALDEAVACYVEGVRLDGDYVDGKSPLSRRTEIQKVADEGLQVIGSRARANPENHSLAVALKNVNYLRSRLAGGCE
jgi:cytochrome c-type biogenesis protein CcmH/NrfG